MALYDISGGYTVASNDFIKDTNLSCKAKGVLLTILSKPNGWDFSIERLAQESRDGKDSIRAGVQELEDAGYLLRVQSTANGRFSGYDYYTNRGSIIDEDSVHGFSADGNAEDKVNTDIANTDIPSTEIDMEKEGIDKSIPKKVPFTDIVARYNELCPSLPRCTAVSERRKAHMRSCWRQFGERMFEAFENAERSDFLSGRSGDWSGCGIDWLTTPNNMLKVLEGNYENKASEAKKRERIERIRRNPLTRDYSGQYDGDQWEEV